MAQLVKTVGGLAIASVKTVMGLAVASAKTINGLDNTSGGGGGTSIDSSKILRWWENGDAADKKNAVNIVNLGSTASETVGPWSTIWNPTSSNDNVAAWPTLTSWDNYTVALVMYPKGSGTLGYYVNSNGTYDIFRLQNSTPFAQIKSNNGTDRAENIGAGAWKSLVFVKDGTNGRLWHNGTNTDTTTHGANAATSMTDFLTGSDTKYACIVVADEAWSSGNVADFHNGGSFLQYSDL